MLQESGTDGVECRKKMANGKKVGGAIKPLVKSRGLRFECARVLHKGLPVLSINIWMRVTLMYRSKMMTWREKEIS